MKNFRLIADNLETAPLLLAIQRRPDLWDQHSLRIAWPATVSPLREGSDIWLRFHELPIPTDRPFDDRETIWYPAMDVLEEARPIIMGLMAALQGERLGRVIVAKLGPGRKVHPHVDNVRLADYYSRYHVPLQTSPGAVFRCGDEQVHMATGEVWWFDNRVTHAAENNGDDDRLHLIVDIRSRASGAPATPEIR